MIELRTVPIEDLRESPTNPRKRYKEQKLEELTQSVRESGIQIPLLVRPTGGDLRDSGAMWEIVAGSRRYRASRRAGLMDVPVMVRSMTDDQVLEVQLLENEQREDVHPLEQAIGYQRLAERGNTAPAIAAKLGCSESHVYKRLKLLDLVDDIQQSFLDDRITAEHAILIARLQPRDQEKAFKEVFKNSDQAISVKSLAWWIEYNVHLDLKNAPFSLKDENLLPDVGACVNCPKRTGFNIALFADIQKEDTCTDGSCFQKKVKAHIDWKLAAQETQGKELLKISSDWSTKKSGPIAKDKYTVLQGKNDRCGLEQKAIVVTGKQDKGSIVTVCADPDCKVHKKQNSSGPGIVDHEKARLEKQQSAEREQSIRVRIFDGILSKSAKASYNKQDWLLIAQTVAESADSDDQLFIGIRHGWIAADATFIKDEEIKRHLSELSMDALQNIVFEICLSQFVHVFVWGDQKRPKQLIEYAARFKVDIKAIEKELKKAETKSTKPESRPAKGKTKSAGKKTRPATEETDVCDNNCDDCQESDCLKM